MQDPVRTGRFVGALILGQILGGVAVNFGLEGPLFGGAGFLVNASAHSLQVGAAVLLGIAMGGITVAIAIIAYPVLRASSRTLALWCLALSTVTLAASVVENINLMSMLSLSDAYATANAAERQQFQVMRLVVASSRNWAHYLGLIIAGANLFAFYLTLLRYALIPRVLAVFGLVAVLLQITAVALPLFGHDVVFAMLAPLGLSQLALAIWLLSRGFSRTALE
jgi:hypothetical protein